MKQFREFLLSLLQASIFFIGTLFIIKGKPTKNIDSEQINFKEIFEQLIHDNFRLTAVVILLTLFVGLNWLKNYFRNKTISKEIINALGKNSENGNSEDQNTLIKKYSNFIQESNFGCLIDDYYNNGK